MKRTLLFLVATVLYALIPAVSFAAQTITPGDQAQSLTQNESYSFANADGYYVNPSFFTKQADGTYKFNAITGTYLVQADAALKYLQIRPCDASGKLTTLTASGQGAVYVIGNNRIGLPSFSANAVSWGPAKGIAMAQVKPSVFELTLVIGQEIGATSDNTDIKFYGTTGWNPEFTAKEGAAYHITSTSDLFDLKASGDLAWKTGLDVHSNDTLVITLDLTQGVGNAVFSTTVKRAVLELTQNESYSLADGYYVNPSFFTKQADGTYKFNAITGTYLVQADNAHKYLQVRPCNAKGTPSSYYDDNLTEKFPIYIIGTGIGFPSVANNEVGWTPAKAIAMAQVSPNVHQITVVVGKEINKDKIGFQFYGGMGYRPEFKGSEGAEFRITSSSDVFGIAANGAPFYKDGANVKDGDTLVITFDFTKGVGNGSLTTSCSETTGIKNVSTKKTDDAWYTISGVRVSEPKQAGIYIKGGQKVMIKK